MTSSKWKYDIAVIGAGGHVGLPLTVTLADVGFTVIGVEKDQSKVEMLNKGIMPFEESGADELLEKLIHTKNARLTFMTDATAVSECENIIVVPGTPLSDESIPDKSQIRSVLNALMLSLVSKQLIILRSTVMPGTTDSIKEYFESNLPVELFSSIDLVFAPERILEGHAIEELRELPQIIGAYSDSAFERASSIFERLGVKTIRLSPIEAEVSKLLANNYRYLQFAVANEFFLICHHLGLNFERIRLATNLDYSRSRIPRSGFTKGPCLGKDSWLLLGGKAGLTLQTGVISSAFRLNEGFPELAVNIAKEELGSLVSLDVLVLGVTFKRDSDDVRDSLAFKLIGLIENEFPKHLSIHDPYVKPGNIEELASKADLIFLSMNHSRYDDSSFLLEAKDECLVVDLWFHLCPELGYVFEAKAFKNFQSEQ